jgi:CheY-like chemotaxis protein
MDLGLPELSGMEATRRIRGLDGGEEVKIVAITASAFASEREAVVSAGFDDFAFKPFRPGEIFGCMAHHLGVRFGPAEAVVRSSASNPEVLRPEALAALPIKFRLKLKDAVTSLNNEQIMSLIDEVEGEDEALGRALRHLGKRYAYTEILTAIARAERESACPSSGSENVS